MVKINPDTPSNDDNASADDGLRELYELHRRCQADQRVHLSAVFTLPVAAEAIERACRVMPFGEFARFVRSLAPAERAEYEQELRDGYHLRLEKGWGEPAGAVGPADAPWADADIQAALRAVTHRLPGPGR